MEDGEQIACACPVPQEVTVPNARLTHSLFAAWNLHTVNLFHYWSAWMSGGVVNVLEDELALFTGFLKNLKFRPEGGINKVKRIPRPLVKLGSEEKLESELVV